MTFFQFSSKKIKHSQYVANNLLKNINGGCSRHCLQAHAKLRGSQVRLKIICRCRGVPFLCLCRAVPPVTEERDC